jgi:hypothetical protein
MYDFCSWGNLRRVPIGNEKNRTGGTGLYYHIDYVGNPRNYKWIQSSPIEKTYEQMSYGLEAGADKLWICKFSSISSFHSWTNRGFSERRRPQALRDAHRVLPCARVRHSPLHA